MHLKKCKNGVFRAFSLNKMSLLCGVVGVLLLFFFILCCIQYSGILEVSIYTVYISKFKKTKSLISSQ